MTSNCRSAFAGLPAIARGTINHYERAACMAFAVGPSSRGLSPQMRRYYRDTVKRLLVTNMSRRGGMLMNVAPSCRRCLMVSMCWLAALCHR